MPSEEKRAPVLVVGGAGFIGGALIDSLLADGERVVVFDNYCTGHPPAPRDGLTVVEGDLRDERAVNAVIAAHRPRAAYNLAAFAYIPYCDEHPVEALQVHVLGLQILMEACRASGSVRRLIHASTAAVYAISDAPHRESDRLEGQEFYGMTKIQGEQQLALFQKSSGISCVATRFFNVYGRGETNPHVIPEIIEQLRAGSTLRLGNITPERDLVHVTDIAHGLHLALNADLPSFEIFNVGTGVAHSVADIVAMLEQILGRTITVETDPARVRAVDRRRLLADISHIRTTLGWEPRVKLEDGLRDLVVALLGESALAAARPVTAGDAAR